MFTPSLVSYFGLVYNFLLLSGHSFLFENHGGILKTLQASILLEKSCMKNLFILLSSVSNEASDSLQ